MPLTIGFFAQMLQGKDLSADYLNKRLNEINKLGEFKRAAFAYDVKKIFSENFEVSFDFIEKWKLIPEPPPGFDMPVRDGLIKIGDDWRTIQADIWIKKIFKNNTDSLVISDGRYINESNAIRSKSNLEYMKPYKGISILLWRPGYENDKPTKSEQELLPFIRKLMKSETGPIENPEIPFDYFLKNDGTVVELYRRIDELVIPYVLKRLS